MSHLYDYSVNEKLWKESGDRIRQLRRMRGITSLDALADLLGVERRLPGRWETGKEPIKKLADLAALAKVLECDPEYITCQSDTLYLYKDNPSKLFGLSEATLDALIERKYSPAETNLYDTSVQRNTVSSYAVTRTLEAIICNKKVLDALCNLVLAESANSPLMKDIHKYWPDSSKSRQEYSTMDSSGADYLPAEQKTFMAEQQFIFELRKVFDN